MNIVLYPKPKINIGLRVTARRSDGYHDIETLFYQVENWREDILGNHRGGLRLDELFRDTLRAAGRRH